MNIQDFLEPKEKGLVIATKDPNRDSIPGKDCSRLFLWEIGRPRKVYGQEKSMYGVLTHNGELLIYTDIEREQGPWLGLYLKNLATGEILSPPFHSGFQHHPYCSHDGELYLAKEIYHPDKYYQEKGHMPIHVSAWNEAVFSRIKKDKTLEEIRRMPAEVNCMISLPSGVAASIGHEPRGDGPNRIINITTGETIYSEPIRLGGWNLGQIHALCHTGKQILISRYPLGIYNTNGEKVAAFSYVEWLLKQERELKVPKLREGHSMFDKDAYEVPDENYEKNFRHAEGVARMKLNYNFQDGIGARSHYRRMRIWTSPESPDDKKRIFRRRVALENFIQHRYNIWNMAYFEGCLILASHQNLYAVRIPSDYDDKPIEIDPLKNKLWTFRDNIEGIAIVEGEELEKLSGQANLRMGARKRNVGRVIIAKAA